jgi:hypothetical protein
MGEWPEGSEEFDDFEHFEIGYVIVTANLIAPPTTRNTVFESVSDSRIFSVQSTGLWDTTTTINTNT